MPQHASAPVRGTILLVEDDREIRETLADELADHGYVVVGAENGREGLSFIRAAANPPALVLLDLMMPVMNGYEFLAERRQDPRLLAIPVAVITADRRVDKDRIGDAPIVWKPFDLDQLLEVVDELTASRGQTGG